jgi:fructose-bisphosphate aldolase class I
MKMETKNIPASTKSAAAAAVAFLSGGQSGSLASTHLNAMHVGFHSQLPWPLTFSFDRAIQQPAMEIWQGKDANIIAAQEALHHRVQCDRAARRGEYSEVMEKACV